MNIIDFLIWIFATIGFTDIVVSSTIMNKFREWSKDKFFFKDVTICPQCMGFHAAYICIMLLVLYKIGIPILSFLCFMFLLACSGSYLAPLGRSILDWFVFSINLNLNNKDE